MGVIKGILAIGATTCSAFAFLMMTSTKFATMAPEFTTRNPLATMALGLLLLCIWALLD